MSTQIRVAPVFRGPVASANGGYACGLIAAAAGRLLRADQMWVSLHRPPPVGVPFVVSRARDRVRVTYADALIAVARPHTEPAVPVPFVPPHRAKAASTRFEGYRAHPAPGCFVCGTAPEHGIGLRVACGPLDQGDGVAGAWTVPRVLPGISGLGQEGDSAFAHTDGRLAAPIVWAVLDCAAAWCFDQAAGFMPLAGMTATMRRPARRGQRLVLVARVQRFDGYAGHTVCTVYDLVGREIATASAMWIRPG